MLKHIINWVDEGKAITLGVDGKAITLGVDPAVFKERGQAGQS